MVAPAQIESNPEWMPQRLDPQEGRVLFARFERGDLDDHGFLANRAGRAEAWLPLAEVKAMRPAGKPGDPQQPDPRFVFHSGFCRSTLLLRALSVPGKAAGLNEPAILNDLARVEQPDPDLTGVVVDLLARRHAPGEAIVIKPSNYQNRLIPALLEARPRSRALLLTGTLRDFLRAVVRKGRIGRQWGRQAALHAANYAGEVEVFKPHLPGMTDLEVAGLGWLLMQNWFHRLREGEAKQRQLAVMHSDTLDQGREQALGAASAHLDLGLEAAQVRAAAQGEAFARDAKTGVDYAEKAARDERRTSSPIVEEEIAEVDRWVGELARASGLRTPVAETLC